MAVVFGTVRGVVHDPQHRPVTGIQAVLKGKYSDFSITTQSDVNGDFHFDAVPLEPRLCDADAGDYRAVRQRAGIAL